MGRERTNRRGWYRLAMAALCFIFLAGALSNAQSRRSCATQSCQSFHDLLSNKDRGILDRLHRTAYVCFLPTEDKFFIAEYLEPNISQEWEDKATPGSSGAAGVFEQPGSASVSAYKNGVFDELKLSPGKWIVTGHRDQKGEVVPRGEATYVSQCLGSEFCRVSITGGEFTLSDSFNDKAGGITEHNISVRLSTARFVDTYDPSDGPKQVNRGTCEIYVAGKLKQ